MLSFLSLVRSIWITATDNLSFYVSGLSMSGLLEWDQSVRDRDLHRSNSSLQNLCIQNETQHAFASPPHSLYPSCQKQALPRLGTNTLSLLSPLRENPLDNQRNYVPRSSLPAALALDHPTQMSPPGLGITLFAICMTNTTLRKPIN